MGPKDGTWLFKKGGALKSSLVYRRERLGWDGPPLDHHNVQ